MLPKKLQTKLETRSKADSLRALSSFPLGGGQEEDLIDFSSNDYLGFAQNEPIFFRAGEILKERTLIRNGATSSRLLSGNHALYQTAEIFLAKTHEVEAALIFNSGYDANVGFFGCVPQRGDVILYDELIHASIRDGIQMSLAKAYKFKHNDLVDLERKLLSWINPGKQDEMLKQVQHDSVVYLVTESVFSMDGDSPDLEAFAALSEKHNAQLIVDEAHAVGVLGSSGLGLVHELGLQDQVFARLVTFGKALGCHGAAVLGSKELKSYLVNFARSLIYTTALPPHSIATIIAAYETLTANACIEKSDDLEQAHQALQKLRRNIQTFNLKLQTSNFSPIFLPSTSSIQSAVIPGNYRVKTISRKLKKEGFVVKAILSPTVPTGHERLRFCLHSFNTEKQITEVLNVLKELLDAVPHDGKDR